MTASIKLGRIWGIPIGFHWSLFLVFVLLATSLAGSYLPGQYPELAPAARWLVALATTVLFFASIMLHELGHAFVALREKLPVNGITLFIFGGVAQIGGQARTAGAEFRIAVGGPLVSLALALAFGALALLVRDVPELAAASAWLARINLMLLLFNLIPGFPLDGGRMLRAAVWHFSGDERRGWRVAQVSGQLVAFGLMGWGGLTILNGNFADGLWLIFIGWFLQNAAASEHAAATVQNQLAGVTVGQAAAMVQEPRLPSRLKLRQVIDDFVLPTGQRYFLVIDGDEPRGLLTLRDIAQVPRDRWDWVSASEVMVPWARLHQVRPDTELLAALRVMDDARVGQLPVVDGGRPVGLLTREEILHYLRLRAELQM